MVSQCELIMNKKLLCEGKSNICWKIVCIEPLKKIKNKKRLVEPTSRLEILICTKHEASSYF